MLESSADPPSFSTFIDHLAHTAPPLNTVNPYQAGDNPYNALRRANLLRYLEQMSDLQPRLMLLLEAPSYQGMRVTGVPAAGRIFTDGVPDLNLFGLSSGYHSVDEPGLKPPRNNQTTSILWGTLAALKTMALVWNAYPFHPHLPGDSLTNRTPRPAEILIGLPFVQELMTLFHCPQVIAVGNVADRSLTLMDIPHIKIRHPAQGGKNKFVSGLQAALNHEQRHDSS
jgi:uracil-DNA glycosylase